MINEKQILNRINLLWKELFKARTFEEIGIKAIQIRELVVLLNRKELIETKPQEPIKNIKDLKKELKKEVVEELKEYKE